MSADSLPRRVGRGALDRGSVPTLLTRERRRYIGRRFLRFTAMGLRLAFAAASSGFAGSWKSSSLHTSSLSRTPYRSSSSSSSGSPVVAGMLTMVPTCALYFSFPSPTSLTTVPSEN